jgi:hypothetical protein
MTSKRKEREREHEDGGIGKPKNVERGKKIF